jgi:hypothetical protein
MGRGRGRRGGRERRSPPRTRTSRRAENEARVRRIEDEEKGRGGRWGKEKEEGGKPLATAACRLPPYTRLLSFSNLDLLRLTRHCSNKSVCSSGG